MAKYEVQAVLRRTYGTLVVEADGEDLAAETAATVDESRWSTSDDGELDIISVDDADADAEIDIVAGADDDGGPRDGGDAAGGGDGTGADDEVRRLLADWLSAEAQLARERRAAERRGGWREDVVSDWADLVARARVRGRALGVDDLAGLVPDYVMERLADDDGR